MPFLDLNNYPSPRAELFEQLLPTNATIVACLCAAWCDVCKMYRPKFELLAKEYPDLIWLWIDIEDEADLVGDIEVENFPTLLIQSQKIVTFFGTMQPDTTQLKRIVDAQQQQSLDQLQAQVTRSEQQQRWQSEANLWERLVAD